MLDQPIVGQLALSPKYMSDEERLNEIGEILAVGLVRVWRKYERDPTTRSSTPLKTPYLKNRSLSRFQSCDSSA